MKLIGIDIGTTTISGIVMEHNIGNNAELIEAKTIASNGVQGVQTRLKRKDRFESK